MKRMLLSLLAGSILFPATASFAQDVTELLRTDLRANKTAIVTRVMALDRTQSDAFWPIYRAYESDLIALNDDALAMVKDYAANYESMTDATASDLLKRGFRLRDARTKLLKKYSGKVAKALSPKIAARWVQVEHALQAGIDIQMASELPLMRK